MSLGIYLKNMERKWAWISVHPKYKKYCYVLLFSPLVVASCFVFDSLYLGRIRSQEAFEQAINLNDRSQVQEALYGWHEVSVRNSIHYASGEKSSFRYSRGQAQITVFYKVGERYLVESASNDND